MLTFNLDKYSLNTNGIMLDVGCGEGAYLWHNAAKSFNAMYWFGYGQKVFKKS